MWIFCPICGALYTDETTTHLDWHAWLTSRLGTPPWAWEPDPAPEPEPEPEPTEPQTTEEP